MTASLDRKLNELKAEYARLRGKPFEHFFCPILFRDEATRLCEGHVVNEAFPASDRRTIVQRADVDSFFGSLFEADFVLLAEKGQQSPVEVLLDRDLSRKLHPQILVEGQAVQHYLPTGAVPPQHSELLVNSLGGDVRLALKMDPNDLLGALQKSWSLDIRKDVRLPALVSLLKAAHLTLFGLLGYSYALTAGGHLMGWDVLGKYAATNMGLPREEARVNALAHFRQFVNLVRPMLAPPDGLAGTISDSKLFLCAGTPKAWAFMVFVRTGAQMHAVLVPVMEDAEAAARFVRFLSEPAPRLEIKLMRFAGDRWEAAKDSRMIDWPPAAFD